MPAPRMTDVAREAGTSTATVSRVMSGDKSVSEALAKQVWAAVDRLGYQPNRVARRLRRPGREMWALIVPELDNQYFTSVARGVEDVASGLGIVVFVGNTDRDADRLRRYIDTALSEQVGGVILAPSLPSDDISALQRGGTPLVVIDLPVATPGVETVMTDHYQGGVLAGAALLEEGRTRVAVIAGPAVDPAWNQRIAGLRDRFEGGDRRVVTIERGDNRTESGRDAMQRILDGDSGADAVFVTNNLMSIGALRELDARGIRIPEDFGMVGYDLNSATLSHAVPITSVNQDPRRIGAVAAAKLAEQRDRPGPPAMTQLAPVLVAAERPAGLVAERLPSTT
jgi:LacI family transcriptional regulator